MFEGDGTQFGIKLMDALPIPADVEFDVPFDHAVHIGTGFGKAILQFDAVAFCPKPGKVFGAVRFQRR